MTGVSAALLLVLSIAVPTLAAEPPCEVSFTNDAADPNSPDFLVRAGYSRDNDDPREGSYETAVIDIELYGRKTQAGKACVYLSVRPLLSTEPENAGGWSQNFFVRNHSLHRLIDSEQKWASQNLPSVFTRFSPIRTNQDPVTEFGKYAKTNQTRYSTALDARIFLGELEDGVVAGRVYLQAPTGRDGTGQPQFTNHDDSVYLVRHVIEWRLDLHESLPRNPVALTLTARNGRDIKVFGNSVSIVSPAWNKTKVESSPRSGVWEMKEHRTLLMWKDVLDRKLNSSVPLYQKWDQLKALEAPESQPHEEVLGRLPAKSRR